MRNLILMPFLSEVFSLSKNSGIPFFRPSFKAKKLRLVKSYSNRKDSSFSGLTLKEIIERSISEKENTKVGNYSIQPL